MQVGIRAYVRVVGGGLWAPCGREGGPAGEVLTFLT